MKSLLRRKIRKAMEGEKQQENTLSPSRSPGAASSSPIIDATFTERNLPTLVESDSQGAVPLDPLQARSYRVDGEVAHGGMGTILHARDLNLRRSVAMKVVLPDKEKSPQYLLRFLQEAQLTAQLEHPNIVPVHELGVNDQGKAYYTMKFVKGVTLREVLEKIKAGDLDMLAKYSLGHLLTVFQKICDAVAFAHSRGVIHRDLKPDNIMLGDYGEVLVMDWGLAKVVNGVNVEHPTSNAERRTATQSGSQLSTLNSQPEGLTLSGQIMGSPQFMSPEQAEGKVDEIDARTDIFALGGILYNILTLHPPATGGSVPEIVEKIRTGSILHPSGFNETNLKRRQHAEVDAAGEVVLSHFSHREIPDSLAAVAMKAMALRKEDRYPTVQELQREIEAYHGGFATEAEKAGTLRLLWLLIKRHRTLFLVSHGALLALVVIGAVAFLHVRAERNHAVASEQRATDTLAKLRATAPLSFAQAQALVEQEHFEEALARISSAVTLAPDNADYHCLKGNILESLLKLKEAATAYGAALALSPNHALAAQNKILCDKIVADNEGHEKPMMSSLFELQMAMRQQGRLVESGSIIRRFGIDRTQALQLVQETLEKAGMPVASLGQDKDSSIGVQVTLNPPVADISALQGLPLSALVSTGTSIQNLKPLRGIPLKFLSLLSNLQLADITPLKGMPLEVLDVCQTSVSDIRVLRGMPLRELNLASTQVSDLNALKGMSLTKLILGNLPVRDLSVLRGLPLKQLALLGMPVSDLSPLKGMPLEILELTATPVSDLGPLRDMPLHHLNLFNCENLHDLSPLADCKQLEWLVLPPQPGNIEFLRKHPSLRRIDFQQADWDTVKPVAEFWKEYDAKKGTQ